MSDEKNKQEALRWFHTGRGDLETAKILLSNSRFAHSCFHAQQAGEKALKALWYFIDQDPWGHSIHKLIEDLGSVDKNAYEIIRELSRDGAKLDRFYIPTRYPNGLPDIIPDSAYFEEDARAAIESAEKILDRIHNFIKEENSPPSPA